MERPSGFCCPVASAKAWQAPPVHIPPRQSWPHPPQFLPSVAGVTHRAPHIRSGAEQVLPEELEADELEALDVEELDVEELASDALDAEELGSPPAPVELDA